MDRNEVVIDKTSPGRIRVTLDGKRIGQDYPTERQARAAVLKTMRERGYEPADGEAAYLNRAPE